MLSYIIPTRNRHRRLHATLDAIASLGRHDAEVIVADNASDESAILPHDIGGLPLRYLRLKENFGAAARNHAAAASSAGSEWLVMLDDDSHPTNLEFLEALRNCEPHVAAVMADIRLPAAQSPLGPARGRRESGGLPEVFVGCGVAIRREAFLGLGGYDAAFGYYAEEYDLAARMLLAGQSIAFEPGFQVLHHKVPHGRDMNLILSRLVRNNGWIVHRYAPASERRERLHETLRRYRAIAAREQAGAGFSAGLQDLRTTTRRQPRSPMPWAIWERFTGISHARAALQAAYDDLPFSTACMIDEGKNAWAIARVLGELGVRLCAERDDAELLVIATLSPGPILDAMEHRGHCGRRVVAPWLPAQNIRSLCRAAV